MGRYRNGETWAGLQKLIEFGEENKKVVDLLSGENHTTSGEVSFGPVNTRQTERQRLTKHGDGRINEGRGGERLALALGKSSPKGPCGLKITPQQTKKTCPSTLLSSRNLT